MICLKCGSDIWQQKNSARYKYYNRKYYRCLNCGNYMSAYEIMMTAKEYKLISHILRNEEFMAACESDIRPPLETEGRDISTTRRQRKMELIKKLNEKKKEETK